MRRREPRPKERRRVPIPDELRLALRDAIAVIRQARRDHFHLDFDDAIQVDGRLCGGRTGEGRLPYVFTYYPSGDGDRGRWIFGMHPLEMRDVSGGFTTELTMWCCTSPGCRRKFRDEHGTCPDCDFVDAAPA